MTLLHTEELNNWVNHHLEDGASSSKVISTTVGFATEDELIGVTLQNLSKFFFRSGSIVASTQVPVGAGVVDVIAASLDPANQLTQAPHPIDSREALVLSKLYCRKPLALRTISLRVSMAETKVEQILTELVSKELCWTNGRSFIKRESRFSELTAIEGKLRDWKRALRQAARNKLFCTRSFVALDAKYSRSALQNLDLFRKSEVGLALVYSSGEVDIVHRPKYSRPLAPVMPIIAEWALLNRLTQQHTNIME